MTTFESERSSGRTTRQLAALPDGSVYVVSSYVQMRYCQAVLVSAGRSMDAITFVVPSGVHTLHGLEFSGYDVDHNVTELGGAHVDTALATFSELATRRQV